MCTIKHFLTLAPSSGCITKDTGPQHCYYSSLQPTNNGDVAHEGSMDVAEALVAFEPPGAEPGHGGGVGLWGLSGDNGREGLCGGHA